MPIIGDGPMLPPASKGIDEYHASVGESLGATIAEAASDLPTVQLTGALEMERAKGNEIDFGQLATGIATPGFAEEQGRAASVPRMDIIEANDRVKKAGLEKHLTLPNQPDIPPAQLEIMMTRARQRREREATMERGPQNVAMSALEVGTSFLVGAIDPINIASAFVPVMGELRYGKLLASAGEGFAARATVRGAVGAAEGAVGQAALEPLDWWSHTQDGRDFGMSDVLHNVLFGAALGGALHAGGGAVSDVVRNRQGRALYPFGPGELMENVRGTHLPADVLHEDGITPEALEAHFRAGEAPDTLSAVRADIVRLREEGKLLDADLADLRAAARAADPAGHEPIFPEDPDAAHVTPAGLSNEVRATRPAEPSPEIRTIDDLPQRAKEDAARAGIANLIDGEQLRVGEMLEAAGRSDPRIAESFEAWHGSPHDFERFDIDKIDTGEGAQAFGHGLYFAQNEKVARDYKRRLSDQEGGVSAKAWDDPELGPRLREARDGYDRDLDELTRLANEGDSAKIGDAQSFLGGALRHWEAVRREANEKYPTGAVYKVRIKADHEHFLDWDKPLREQSEHVRSKLNAAGYADEQTGKDVYHSLVKYRPSDGGGTSSAGMKLSDLDATPESASGRLRATGIHGIKYLDQGSRSADQLKVDLEGLKRDRMMAEDAEHENPSDKLAALKKIDAEIAETENRLKNPTRNFVVFDDKHIEITHKNGEPVNREQFLQERRGPVDSFGFPPDELDSSGPHPDPLPGGERGRAADVAGSNVVPIRQPLAAAESAINRDAAWRALSVATPDFNEPAVIAASKAAAEVKAPPTRLDERVTAAQKADAYAKQMVDMFGDRLEPQERQRLDDLIKTIDGDNEAREIAIQRGAACLFGAR